MKIRCCFIFIFIVSLNIGCATIPQGVAPSASPLVSADGKSLKYETLGKAEGKAGHFNLFGFIPFGRCDLNGAISQAVQKKNGDNLINAHFNAQQTSYLIFGNYTTFIVRGDVVKYSEKPSLEAQPPAPAPVQSALAIPLALSHRLAISPFTDFGSEYTLMWEFNKPFFASVSLGYRRAIQEETFTYSIGGGNSERLTVDYSTNAIPLTIQAGINGGQFLNDFLTKAGQRALPINPYASGGVGYYPTAGDDWSVLIFGWSLTIGAEYAVSPSVALGLEWKTYNSFYDNRDSYYYFYSSNTPTVPEPNLSFNNLSLTIRFTP
jgi:opacity protein-like surface antigen